MGESLNDLLPADITRFSFMSNDSGIERDLPPGAEPSPSLSSSLESGGPSNSWEHCKRQMFLYFQHQRVEKYGFTVIFMVALPMLL